jgi:methionyl aminopeptidase
MSITKETELIGMKKASEAVACTLKEMREYAQPGMTTKQLDDYGAKILSDFGAKSAPYVTYGFPGWTCISVNNEFCHGIPSDKRILKEGDLVNIDVSANLMDFGQTTEVRLCLEKTSINTKNLSRLPRRFCIKLSTT